MNHVDRDKILGRHKPLRHESFNDVIRRQLIDGDFTLTDVIDQIIEMNGIIGVGLITLGDALQTYCYNWKNTNGEKAINNR